MEFVSSRAFFRLFVFVNRYFCFSMLSCNCEWLTVMSLQRGVTQRELLFFVHVVTSFIGQEVNFETM